MSTHLDAVFSKCHPVRQWSGSSSASPPPPATTRCWKAYSLTGRRKREAGSAPFVAAILFVPTLLFSQQTAPAPTTPAHPEVVNLTLKGVSAMKKAELLQSIYTTPSYYNNFILKPFCWISKSKYFYTKK